jgi:DNA replicative helicase MCM subunit Mcm2 (Cdc46/Mcm family)
MKIKTITSRLGGDFYAIFECEHCGHFSETYGYEDRIFHDKVVPAMQCKECGKNRLGENLTCEKTYSKYKVSMILI